MITLKAIAEVVYLEENNLASIHHRNLCQSSNLYYGKIVRHSVVGVGLYPGEFGTRENRVMVADETE